MNEKLLMSFYCGSIESILKFCVCAWCASSTVADRKAIQRVTTTAQKFIDRPLPSLEGLYNSHCLSKAKKHPAALIIPWTFSDWELGKRKRTIKTSTNRFKKQFLPKNHHCLPSSLHPPYLDLRVRKWTCETVTQGEIATWVYCLYSNKLFHFQLVKFAIYICCYVRRV